MFFDDKQKTLQAGESLQGIDDDRLVVSPDNQSEQCGQVLFPPGLIGEIAQYIYDQSPRPHLSISLAGAIAFMAGICGRSYNTYTGAGLNQYILLLASTGMGKEAAAGGIANVTC